MADHRPLASAKAAEVLWPTSWKSEDAGGNGSKVQ